MYARILRGNSDTTQTTTARKQTKCDAMPLLISFNCFLKKRKKAKEARKRCIQGGGKNETLTRMNYYRHLRRTFRFTSLGSFFYHINGIICIIIVVSIIILSRSLSLSLTIIRALLHTSFARPRAAFIFLLLWTFSAVSIPKNANTMKHPVHWMFVNVWFGFLNTE